MPSNQLHGARKRGVLLPQAAGFATIPALAERFLPSKRMQELYRRVQLSADRFDLESLLTTMRVDLHVEAADAARIPANGPAVVVANHPFGVLDGAALAVLLMRVRPDVKVVTNFPLEEFPEFRQHCIVTDASPSDSNSTKIWEAEAWLRREGMLAIFPAGEVSQWQLPQAQISDLRWNDTAVQLIRETGASALPVYFCGRNSIGFHLFGMIHPRLRAAFLLQEFLQQEGRRLVVRVGSVIPGDAVAGIGDNQEATEYLRWRTYLLARRKRAETSSPFAAWPFAVRSKLSEKVQQPVAAAEPGETLAAELEHLGAEQRLAESGDLTVYLVKADEAPRMLRELGRVREVTFRAAGEGTGKPRDLDRFDRYYWQLLLWNKTKQELVGGYRVGNTAEILAERGVRGLYTSTLFRYDGQLFEKIGPALELGRSFVRPEYQRQYAPLLLL